MKKVFKNNEIKIDDNTITTTSSNADLELRANGTGNILIPNNNVVISNDLQILGTTSFVDLTSTGTITSAQFSTGDIIIRENFITTTNSNSNVDEQGDLPTTCSSPYFIGVTNTDKDDLKVTNAGFGQEHIDLSAPGRNTETFKPDSQYGTFGGTSASAPHVTGALGLLYSIKCENLVEFIKERPGEAALRIRQSILKGTDALPSLNGVTASGGRLNILKSMSDLSEFCSNDPTIPISGDLQVDFVREDKNGAYTIFYKSPDTREVTLTIYDMIGRKLYTTQSIPSVFSRSNERINLDRYQAGVYIATLSLEDEVVSYKFRHISQ